MIAAPMIIIDREAVTSMPVIRTAQNRLPTCTNDLSEGQPVSMMQISLAAGSFPLILCHSMREALPSPGLNL
jgi:hypothetical protein